MTKTYFVKISWVDPNQPLVRIHANDTVQLDLTKSPWDTIKECDMQVYGYSERKTSEISIDFMIEVPE